MLAYQSSLRKKRKDKEESSKKRKNLVTYIEM
jgi:hypothetical protein